MNEVAASMLARRLFLKSLLGAAVVSAASCFTVGGALAKDGGHDGGHDDGGHDDGGHRGSNRSRNGDDDDGGLHQDDVLLARRGGKIISLKTALRIVDARVPGKVIDVTLTGTVIQATYCITVRRKNGEITTVKLNARTGSFIGRPGF